MTDVPTFDERPTTRGLTTASGSHGKVRVYLDGVDVSRNCVTADDRYGWVVLLNRDDNGHPKIRHVTGCPNFAGPGKFIMHRPGPDGHLVAEQEICCSVGCGLDVELRTGVVELTPWPPA
jgi:hypothetical protein